jgi:hypothetical protein
VTGTGSGTAGDVQTLSLLLGYEGVPGISATFISPEKVVVKEVASIQVTLTPTAAGAYTGAVGLANVPNQLKAGKRYVLIGAACSVDGATFGVRSPDFGNLRIGLPLMSEWEALPVFFTTLPVMPTISADNRNQVYFDLLSDEVLTSTPVSIILGEL